MLLPAAVSLNRGCEDRPSRRKGGWEMGTEGAGAGVGPPREGQRVQGDKERRKEGRERKKEGREGGRKGDRNGEEDRDNNKAIRAICLIYFFKWSMYDCGEKTWRMFVRSRGEEADMCK